MSLVILKQVQKWCRNNPEKFAGGIVVGLILPFVCYKICKRSYSNAEAKNDTSLGTVKSTKSEVDESPDESIINIVKSTSSTPSATPPKKEKKIPKQAKSKVKTKFQQRGASLKGSGPSKYQQLLAKRMSPKKKKIPKKETSV
jgi:hypothetical protein